MSRSAALEQRLGHRFADPRLLEQALAHGGHEFQRLEFLGDAVLDCVAAEELYRRFPSLQEGPLHRLQVSMIRESTLAEAARSIALDAPLMNLMPVVRDSTLADALEAVFGAVFLDGGYAEASKCILHVLAPFVSKLSPESAVKDAKTQLQEVLQARFKTLPTYRQVGSGGAAHEKTFKVECQVKKLDLATDGAGSSLQRAEQDAAQAMLRKIGGA